MSRVVRRTFLAQLTGLAAGAASSPAGADDFPPKGRDDEPLSPLWKALLNALPAKYRTIDAYAENPSQTLVLFRSRKDTLVFSFQTGKVEAVPHQKFGSWAQIGNNLYSEECT